MQDMASARPDQPLSLAVQRNLIELVDAVVADLDVGGARPSDSGVHEARKKLKRIRAILRLVRDPMGEDIYRHENVVMRDAGRGLSEVRDAWVRTETLTSVADRHRDRLDRTAVDTTGTWLLEEYERILTEFTNHAPTAAVTALEEARARYEEYPFETMIPDDFASIAPGLERVYRRGHLPEGESEPRIGRSARGASGSSTCAISSSSSRRTTHRPPPPSRTILDRLGEAIGRDHDLDVLDKTLTDHVESCPDERSRVVAAGRDRHGSSSARCWRWARPSMPRSPRISSRVDRDGSHGPVIADPQTGADPHRRARPIAHTTSTDLFAGTLHVVPMLGRRRIQTQRPTRLTRHHPEHHIIDRRRHRHRRRTRRPTGTREQTQRIGLIHPGERHRPHHRVVSQRRREAHHHIRSAHRRRHQRPDLHPRVIVVGSRTHEAQAPLHRSPKTPSRSCRC